MPNIQGNKNHIETLPAYPSIYTSEAKREVYYDTRGVQFHSPTSPPPTLRYANIYDGLPAMPAMPAMLAIQVMPAMPDEYEDEDEDEDEDTPLSMRGTRSRTPWTSTSQPRKDEPSCGIRKGQDPHGILLLTSFSHRRPWVPMSSREA